MEASGHPEDWLQDYLQEGAGQLVSCSTGHYLCSHRKMIHAAATVVDPLHPLHPSPLRRQERQECLAAQGHLAALALRDQFLA